MWEAANLLIYTVKYKAQAENSQLNWESPGKVG